MSIAVSRVVEVVIADDKETTIAFQQWALARRIYSTGPSGVFEGGLRYYFDAEHESEIRRWLVHRYPDPVAEDRARARPAIVAEVKADLEARYPIPKKR